jgi:hypothetical protein
VIRRDDAIIARQLNVVINNNNYPMKLINSAVEIFTENVQDIFSG